MNVIIPRRLHLEPLEERRAFSANAWLNSAAGDFSLDGRIDGSDFLVWQRQIGSNSSYQPADANGDGYVDNADLDAWRSAVGNDTGAVIRNWPLRLQGSNLMIDAPGGVRSIADKARSFALDSQERLLVLHYGGLLLRSTETFGRGEWEQLAYDASKFMLDASDNLWVLNSNQELKINGSLAWANSLDFSLSETHLYLLNANGSLDWMPFGGSWSNLTTNVASFSLQPNGDIYAHLRDHRLLRNRDTTWDTIDDVLDYRFDDVGRLVVLGGDAHLRRSPDPFADEWESLAVDVTKFSIAPSGEVWTLHRDNAIRIDGLFAYANTKDFLITPSKIFWLGTSGVLEWKDHHGAWEPLTTTVTKFAVGPVGELYAHLLDGRLMRHLDLEWEAIPHALDFTLSPDGALALDQLNPDGTETTTISRQFSPDRKIINPISEEPWDADDPRRLALEAVGLIKSTSANSVSFGTGTLMGGNYVITAKHVVANYANGAWTADPISNLTFSISRGSGIAAAWGQYTFQVRNIILHPTDDIALLALQMPVGLDARDMATWSKFGLPYPDGFSATARSKVAIAGYGLTGSGVSGEDRGTGQMLRYGKADYDFETSSRHPWFTGIHLANEFHINESFIAHGDSGGPDFYFKEYVQNHPGFPSQGIPPFVTRTVSPVLVGVHSYALRPTSNGYQLIPESADGTTETRYGDVSFSVKMSQSMVNWILSKEFQLLFGEPSSPATSIASATISLNGIALSSYQAVSAASSEAAPPSENMQPPQMTAASPIAESMTPARKAQSVQLNGWPLRTKVQEPAEDDLKYKELRRRNWQYLFEREGW